MIESILFSKVAIFFYKFAAPLLPAFLTLLGVILKSKEGKPQTDVQKRSNKIATIIGWTIIGIAVIVFVNFVLKSS